MYREQLLLPMNLNKPSNHFLQPLFGASIFFVTPCMQVELSQWQSFGLLIQRLWVQILSVLSIFKDFFNESGIMAGKFKGDKNPGEKFYQRFSKVLIVLMQPMDLHYNIFLLQTGLQSMIKTSIFTNTKKIDILQSKF